MDQNTLDDLLTKVAHLRALKTRIENADLDPNNESLLVELQEFYNLLQQTRTTLVAIPGLPVDEDAFAEREEDLSLLQEISAGEPFQEVEGKKRLLGLMCLWNALQDRDALPSDIVQTLADDFSAGVRRLAKAATQEELQAMNRFLSINESEDLEELGALAEDLYFPWFSQYDYIDGLRRAGTLIARIDSLPEHLAQFLSELKQAYAFQRYLAVAALSRTVLEICMRDLYNLNRFNERGSWEHEKAKEFFQEPKATNWRRYDPSLDEMRHLLCEYAGYEAFDEQIRALKTEMNRVIHGRRVVKREDAERLMRETLLLIHQLYAA